MTKAKLVVLILLCIENVFKCTIASDDYPSTNGTEAGNCADIIELDSESGASQMQKRLLGTYVKQERTLLGWEVYKKSCNDDLYLYRDTEGNAQDWLFGRWSGNNVGWVKHLRCGKCPEKCPRTWVYWDPSRTQWYYDYSIRVTDEKAEDHCFRTWHLVFPALAVLICFCACCCRKSDRADQVHPGGGGIGGGGARIGRGGAKPTGGAGGKKHPAKIQKIKKEPPRNVNGW